jgi:hypothetical protein
MKLKISISLFLVFALAVMSFAVVSAEDPLAVVYVGHGIPGQALGLEENDLPVDVSVDGGCLLEAFTFGEFAGPVELPAGDYEIAISLADAEDPCSADPVIGPTTVTFESGVNYTVFAHLTEEGAPTASVFVNDVSKAVAGYSRLTVRHTAAAPAVDIELYRGWSGGRMVGVIEGLENPEQAGPLNLRPGRYEAVILAAGTEDVVLAVPVVLMPHKSYIVYAVGGLETETFTVLVQVLELGVVPPGRPVPPAPPVPPKP